MLKKAYEKKLNAIEIRLLRWMCGVTMLDRIANKPIRGMMKVGETSRKVQERRLQWYRHVMRGNEEHVGKKVLKMEVDGRRKRGRPKRRGGDCTEEDLKEKGLMEADTGDQGRWKTLVSNCNHT